MKFVDSRYEILTDLSQENTEKILRTIEACGRVCYKTAISEDIESTNSFIQMLVKRKHTSVLEHFCITVRFICDRAIANEIVRHRLASYSQESTRFCNYAGSGIEIVNNPDIGSEQEKRRRKLYQAIEKEYNLEIREGIKPQIARDVLPLCLKTEIIMTANFTEWRHFFNSRVLGNAGKPHPQMILLCKPLLEDFKKAFPPVFCDL
jgi:thymidylate synthase (FAD)